MKTTAAFFFLMFVFNISAAAQEKKTDQSLNRANFNGTWIFDGKKSNLGDPLQALYQERMLVISYTGQEFKIVKTQIQLGETRSANLVFYTDDRGEKNRPYPFNQLFEIRSQTVWEKDVLVRSYKIKAYLDGKEVDDVEASEEYKLSDEGKTLIIYGRTKFPKEFGFKNSEGGFGKSKIVYRKKE